MRPAFILCSAAAVLAVATAPGAHAQKTPTEAKKPAKSKISPADAKFINNTNTAAQAKLDARDFAGAVDIYQKAIDSAPTNAARHILYLGLSLSLRRQGIAAYNSGDRPVQPPPGSGNDAIRAYNAAVLASQAQRRSAAVPLLDRALVAGAQAATLSDAQTDKSAEEGIGTELREIAYLLYQVDRDHVLAKARPSAPLEAVWLRRWLGGATPLAESLVAKYGVPVAAALVVQDPAAGLTLADEVRAKTGADPDGATGYAEIVVAAKLPAGDPRRAQALAGLTAAQATINDSQRLAQLRTALSATK